MNGKHCRLYDEELVKNIMVSTGLLILDYLKEKPEIDEAELCDFIETNADNIIDDTIDEINETDPGATKSTDPSPPST